MKSFSKKFNKHKYSKIITTLCIALFLLLVALFTLPFGQVHIAPDEEEPGDHFDDLSEPYIPPSDELQTPPERQEFRAAWVASVFNLDFPSRQNMSPAAMKWEIDLIVRRAAEINLNAIIFQVRPTGDALYESSIFPWSHWLSGVQGENPSGFDPLAYFIESAHAKNIELHAWLNPYRIIHTATNSSDPNTLSEDNPVRLNPELAVAWTNANDRDGLFLDPGLPEARALIIAGIEEIIRNYDVDGIHIDDYFYPGSNFDDSASFLRYGGDMSLGDWRRDNVNTLIRDIQTTIRDLNYELDRNVAWGVSPVAIWKNGSTDPLGVPGTRGQESYYELYADTRLWVTEELVDYIIPQIYWYIGFERADFESVFNWWEELCRDYNVDLFIGHAAWREADRAENWDGEILRQLEMLAQSPYVDGSVFYRMYSLSRSLGRDIGEFYREKDDIPVAAPFTLDTLSIGFPRNDVTLSGTADSAPGHNIVGTSVPELPLYMNGVEVTNRTPEGFFFVYALLEDGDNEFEFSQEGLEPVTRIITRNTPAEGGPITVPADIVVTEVTVPRYATVSNDMAWAYSGHTTAGGSNLMLTNGQTDRVIAESDNNFVKLSSGVWMRGGDVTVSSDGGATNPLKNGEYRSYENYDKLVWQSNINIVANTTFDGSVLTVRFGMHSAVPELTLSEDLEETLFSAVSYGVDDGTAYYAFTIRDDVRFEGFYTEFESLDELGEEYGEFRIVLRRRRALGDDDLPLSGFTILLDPGHGGEAPGALGALGMDMPESDMMIDVMIPLRRMLEELGATVYTTRYEDYYVSLTDRVTMSRRIMPDLFLSLHVNSVAETTNAQNVRGFVVYYRNYNAVEFSQVALNIMHYMVPNTTRSKEIRQANFYVCRQSWTPAILLEYGFIINIQDFAWLINPSNIELMAEATVVSVIEYFS